MCRSDALRLPPSWRVQRAQAPTDNPSIWKGGGRMAGRDGRRISAALEGLEALPP